MKTEKRPSTKKKPKVNVINIRGREIKETTRCGGGNDPKTQNYVKVL